MDFLHEGAGGFDGNAAERSVEDFGHGIPAMGTRTGLCALRRPLVGYRSDPPENACTSSTRSPSFSGRFRIPSTNISSLIATFTRESSASRARFSCGYALESRSKRLPTFG